MARVDWRGCFTALITPFRDGEIDLPALRAWVERQCEAGVAGLVPCGTTGESPTLTPDEQIAVIRATVEAAAGRVPVVAGCGSNATAHAIALTRAAEACGADATLQVVPYYNRPQQEGLFRHFRAIAEASSLPIVLYDIPGRTGCGLSLETIERLARLENVVAIKEATGSVRRVHALRQLGLAVLSGDDALTLPMIALGATGVISVTSNLVPHAMQSLCEAALAGERERALALHTRLAPLFEALFVESNPAPVKWAASRIAAIDPRPRPPLAPLSPAHHAVLHRALEPFEADLRSGRAPGYDPPRIRRHPAPARGEGTRWHTNAGWHTSEGARARS